MATRPSLPMAPLPKVRFAGRFADSAAVPFHVHAGSELVLVVEGACAITVQGGERLSGGRGSVFVLPRGVAHDQVNDGRCRTAYVDFDAAPIAFSDKPRVVRLDDGDPALGWFEDVCRLSLAPAGGDDAIVSALLLAVLERLKAVEHRAHAARALPRAVVDAVRRLEADLVEPLSVRGLARAVGLGPSHLSALFRRHLGCPPLQYQQRLRLSLARALLRDSYLSVAEVAAACGYGDANYFIRVFRARLGTTPSRWRRTSA